MTRKPRFSKIAIVKAIYVSSSSHYFIEVWCQDSRLGKSRKFSYCPGFASPMENSNGDVITVPQYFYDELYRQIVDAHEKGELRFYEFVKVEGRHRGERPRRYEGLRYHDPDHWLFWVHDFRTELGVQA